MMILLVLQVKNIEMNKNNVENRYCQYRSIEFGKNVQLSNDMCNGAKHKTVELDRMKNNHVMIVVKLNDLNNSSQTIW